MPVLEGNWTQSRRVVDGKVLRANIASCFRRSVRKPSALLPCSILSTLRQTPALPYPRFLSRPELSISDLPMHLSEVRRHALSLPEVTEEPHFDYSSFRVRGKIFVTVPPDGEHIHVFLAEEERNRALERAPDFAEELHWGKKILGVRITLPIADSVIVKDLVSQAWRGKAPASIGGAAVAKKTTAKKKKKGPDV
jgi:hypothetical protein